MEASLDLVPGGFIAFTDDGTILCVNEPFCGMLGYSKEELAASHLEKIITVASKIFTQTHLIPVLQLRKQASEIFLTFLAKDKSDVPVLLNAQRITKDKVEQNNCICIALHHRKKFEDELVVAKKKAEKALLENTALNNAKNELQEQAENLDQRIVLLEQRNEELQQVNRIVTHNLQEPLRKFSVLLSIMEGQDGDTPPEEKKELVDKLHHSNTQLKSTVSGLQQYVWVNDINDLAATVELNDLLADVQVQLAKEFGDDLLAVSQEVLPTINGYAQQLHALFYHLLSNAIKFRKEGKQAEVTITSTIFRDNIFKNTEHKYKYKDFLRLQITDNGVGFDPQFKTEVFNLFSRLHNNSGRGLGLALCKKIVDNHNGTIKANSKLGAGSIFTILLPVYVSDYVAAKDKRPSNSFE